MGAVMTRHLISCLAIVRQIRAAYDTGAGASDPKTNKQVVYSVQLAGSVRTYTFNTFGKLEELKFVISCVSRRSRFPF